MELALALVADVDFGLDTPGCDAEACDEGVALNADRSGITNYHLSYTLRVVGCG